MSVASLFPAACTPADSHLFFGREGEHERTRRNREAKAMALCAGCPARAACLAGALDRREPHGIWGGRVFDHGRPKPEDIADLCTNDLHVMDEANTYIRPGTCWKYCRACRRDRESQKEVAA